MSALTKLASRINALPVLSLLSPPVNQVFSETEKRGFLACQQLALKVAKDVADLAREGWTEQQAADLFDVALRDHGVKAYFHFPFAWFGERARFAGIRRYSDFAPSKRVLLPGEVFILDAAPILNGYIADIGYTTSLGENAELKKAQAFLDTIRSEIPSMFKEQKTGSDFCRVVDQKIRAAGYDNIHEKYPFSVLGHRVHKGVPEKLTQLKIWNFGWQSFWAISSRGVFGQLLNSQYQGDKIGLWAIEPHIGGQGFGAKFEEILVVEPDKIHWLRDPIVC